MSVRSVAWLRCACSTVLLTGLIAGCASSDVAATGKPDGPAVSPSPYKSAGTASPAAGPSAASASAAGNPGASAIPSGAKYTIMCRAFPGTGSAAMATTSKDNLVRATGRRNFYVVHEENQSTLYYGYYKEYQRAVDPKEAATADADLAYLKNLADDQGVPLFARSMFVPLPAADPVAPVEYDLARLDADKPKDDPNRKYWSIAIAAFTADAVPDPSGPDAGKNRKQIAVECVMAARKQGVEAYYYHGPSISMVCIGAWPQSAIRRQMTDTEIKQTDNGDPLIVSSVPLPPKVMEDIQNSGKHVTVVQPKMEIDDKSLENTWKAYSQYEVNGQLDIDVTTDPITGQKKRKPKSSFLVEIPLAQPNNMLATGRGTQAAEPERAPETNPLRPGQGVGAGGTGGGGMNGRLRSVSP